VSRKGKENRAPEARVQAFGCPPGIRTPIERVRVACPTIERGGTGQGLAGVANALHSLTDSYECTCLAILGQRSCMHTESGCTNKSECLCVSRCVRSKSVEVERL
jgi:hypothetical protein